MHTTRLVFAALILGSGACGDVGSVAGPGGGGAVDLPDASVAERVPGANVLYRFDEGAGTTVTDSSGAAQPLDLAIADPAAAQWIDGGGLSITGPTVLRALGPASALGPCRASNEVTIEAWVRPISPGQAGPARIVSFATGIEAQNFVLGQEGDAYDIYVKAAVEEPEELAPQLLEPGSVAVVPQLVTYTRTSADQLARLYIDGLQVAATPVEGDFNGWDMAHSFTLASDSDGQRPWLGDFHLVAVYCRALSPKEVYDNYVAGH